MSAPLGEARVRVDADASDFPDELERAIDQALEQVVRSASDAFGDVEQIAGSAGAAVAGSARDGVAAAQRALDSVNANTLDDVRARAQQMGQALADARKREADAAKEALDAEAALKRALNDQSTSADDLQRATDRLEQAQRRSRDASRDAATMVERNEQAQDRLNNSNRDGASAAGSLGESVGDLVGKLGAAAVGIAGLAAAGDTMFEAFDRQSLGGKLKAQLDLSAEESATAGKMAGDLYAQNYGDSFEAVNDAIGSVHSSLANLTHDPALVEGLTKKALTLASAFGVDVAESAATVGIMVSNGIGDNATEAFDLLAAAMQRVPASMRDELLPVLDEYSTYLGSLGFKGEDAIGLIVNAAEQGAIGMDKAGDALKEFGIRATDIGDKGATEALQSMGFSASEMANQLLAGGDTAQGAFNKIVDGLLKINDPAQQAAAATALFGTPLEDIDKAKIPGFLEGLRDAGVSMEGFAGTTDEMAAALSEGPSAALETFKRQVQDAMLNGLGAAAGYLLEHKGLLYALAGALGAAVLAYGTFRVAAVVSSVAQGISTAATGANTAALAGNKIALGAAAVAQGVMKAGQMAGAVATGIATAAQWAWNSALLASPITWIVVGIAAIVAALVLFFTKTELGKKIWDAVWNGIKDTLSFVWESIIKPIFGAFMDFLGWIGEKAMWLWETIIQPVFGFIGAFIGVVFDGILLAFRLGIAVFEVAGEAVRRLWDYFIFPILSWIGDKFLWLWNSVIMPVVGWIKDRIMDGLGVLQWIWDTIIFPVMSWIGDKFSWLYNSVILPVAGWIGDRLADIGGFFQGLWDKVLAVAGWIMGKLGEVRDWFGNIAGTILGAMGDGAKVLWDWGVNLIQGLLDGAGSLLGKIGDWFLDKVPGWIKEPFKKALGINSPSRVFIGYGKNIGEGLIAGVDAMSDQVQSATQAMADAAGDVSLPTLAAPALAAAPAPSGVGPAPTDPLGGAGALGVAAPAVDALGLGVATTATEVVDPALAGMQTNLTALAETFPAVNDGTIQPALAAMGTGVVGVKDALVDPALWGIQGNLFATGSVTAGVVQGTVLPQWNQMGAGIMGVKVGTIDPAFAGIQGGLQTVQGAFATGVGAISAQWDQMRGAVSRPVRFAIDTVFNNGLVGMWNSVSDLLGTQKMNPFVVGGFAKGTSVLPGYSPGYDDMQFVSRDGRTAINLSGGEGIARPEVVRGMGRAQFDALNRAAATGGVGGVQRVLGNFALGGVVDRSLWNAVKSAFPAATLNSAYRPGHSGYHGKAQAIDVGGPMQQIANWAYRTMPGLAQLIYGPGPLIAEGNTDQGYARNYFRDDIAGHFDHVHMASRVPVDNLGKLVSMDGASLGAAAAFSMADYVKAMTQGARDQTAAAVAGFQQPGIIGQLPAKVFESMSKAMDAKLTKLAEDFSADPGGAGVERWRPLAMKALAWTGYVPPEAYIENMLKQIATESGGNPGIVQGVQDVNSGGNEAVGLLQVIPNTFAAYRDPRLPNDRRDPFANMVAALNWVSARYNRDLNGVWGKGHGYDAGGEAVGRGLLPKNILDPERVLSTEQTRAFNALVSGLTMSGTGEVRLGGLTLTANGDLRINENRLGSGNAGAGSLDGKRILMVNQYITGDDPKRIADDVSARLLALI